MAPAVSSLSSVHKERIESPTENEMWLSLAVTLDAIMAYLSPFDSKYLECFEL